MIRTVLLTLCFCLLINSPAYAKKGSEPINVVASFSIIADMVKTIGGDKVNVQTLAGTGGSAHHKSPTPQDIILISKAEIIAINGLSFETWLDPAIKASKTKARLLVTSAGVTPRWKGKGASQRPDPHAWMSIKNARTYALNIMKALTQARPEWRETFKENTTYFLKDLKDLHRHANKLMWGIPAENRILATNHDSFGYFAADYGLKYRAITNAHSHDAPSPKKMAKFIRYVKKRKVKALFFEYSGDDKLVQNIAMDTKARVGEPLFVEILAPEGIYGSTYIEMMRHNIKRIEQGLNP